MRLSIETRLAVFSMRNYLVAITFTIPVLRASRPEFALFEKLVTKTGADLQLHWQFVFDAISIKNISATHTKYLSHYAK